MARTCKCASLGLAFTAIGLFLMLLWASVQAVPASLEKPEHPRHDTKSLVASSHNINCSYQPLNRELCKYLVLKRMKHRSHDNSNINNEPSINSLHERQVRSVTKNNFPHDKRNTFVSFEDDSRDIIRNISLNVKVMNNGESVSEPTLATFKESNVKTNAEKETSDKTYLHVNGECARRLAFDQRC